MYAKTIISVSFPLAWQWAVEFVRKSKYEISFGGGKEIKHAVDSQCTIILDSNAVRDVLNHVTHPSDPFATPDKIKHYIDEYSDGFDASIFDYTYYDILKRGFFVTNSTEGCFLNQINVLRKGLMKQKTEKLSSNRNVAVLWNPIVQSSSNKSQPCLNEVSVRWMPGDKAVIYNHFRSHDLFAAWGANMIAITEFLNRDVIKPCGCELDGIVETNFSLHIYKYDLEQANEIKELHVSPALQRLQFKYNSMNYPSSIFDEYLESEGVM